MYVCIYIYTHVIEGNSEVKLPTYGQMQQRSWEQSEKRKSQKKVKKVEKSQNTVFFQCFVAPAGPKQAR